MLTNWATRQPMKQSAPLLKIRQILQKYPKEKLGRLRACCRMLEARRDREQAHKEAEALK